MQCLHVKLLFLLHYECVSPRIPQVVLPNYFSEGGAEQLHHDVTAALRPLLAKFTDEMSSRQLMERWVICSIH